MRHPLWVASLATVIGAAALVGGVGEVLSGLNGDASHFCDDSFYYIVTARNYVEQGVFTFDGINETNGFHPLWMWLVTAVQGALGAQASQTRQIVGVKVLELVCLMLAVLIAGLSARRLAMRGSPLAYGMLGAALALLFSNTTMIGMETTVAAAVLVAILAALSLNKTQLVSALLPVLFLARLDAGVFVGSAVLGYLAFTKGWWRGVKLGVPLAIVVVAFSGWNYVQFGQMAPVSGWVKSSFPIPEPKFGFLLGPLLHARQTGMLRHLFLPNMFNTSLLLLIGAGALVAWRRQLGSGQRTDPQEPALGLFFGIAAVLLLNNVTFQRWNKGVEVWYLVLPTVALFFALFALGSVIATRLRLLLVFRIFLLTTTAVFLVWNVSRLPMKAKKVYRPSAEESFIASLPRDAVLAGTDVGQLSFRTARRIVNLDGLINSYSYQYALRDQALKRFLIQSRVRYAIVDGQSERVLPDGAMEPVYEHRVSRGAVLGGDYQLRFRMYSHPFRTFSEPLCLERRDEVFRGDLRKDGWSTRRTIIYNIEAALKRNCNAQDRI